MAYSVPRSEGKNTACPAVNMADQGSNSHGSRGKKVQGPQGGPGPHGLSGWEPAQE